MSNDEVEKSLIMPRAFQPSWTAGRLQGTLQGARRGARGDGELPRHDVGIGKWRSENNTAPDRTALVATASGGPSLVLDGRAAVPEPRQAVW